MTWEVLWSTFVPTESFDTLLVCKRKRCSSYEEAAIEAAAMHPLCNAQPVLVPDWVFER